MLFRIRMPPLGGWILHQLGEGDDRPGHRQGREPSDWPHPALERRCGEDLAPACGLGVASGLSLLLWAAGLLLLRQFG